MFLLNLAVSGVINWPGLERYLGKRKEDSTSAQLFEVNIHGKTDTYKYIDRVDRSVSGTPSYWGLLKRPGAITNTLLLRPKDKTVGLWWQGDVDHNSMNRSLSVVEKFAGLSEDGTVERLTIGVPRRKQVEIHGMPSNVHVVDTNGPRQPDEIEIYSLEEAQFLIERYLNILEQIQAPEEAAVV